MPLRASATICASSEAVGARSAMPSTRWRIAPCGTYKATLTPIATLLESGALGAQVGGPATVRVEPDRCDALGDELTRLNQSAGEPLVRVRVHVDEARRDDEAGGVDLARRRGVSEPPHVDDPSIADADVRRSPRIAAAVHDPSMADQDVVAAGRLCEGRGGERE